MPELTLTLADVERLEAAYRAHAAKYADAKTKAANLAFWADMGALLADQYPALLALAREALERRRDADAPDILEPAKPVASFALEATLVPTSDAKPFIPEDRDHA